MKYGFIASLPRSGSGWLANYLSYGNSCFLHDPWKDTAPSDLRAFFESSGAYTAGVADSGNVVLFDKINKDFPDAKWVVVTRPEKEVQESCKSLGFPLADFGKGLAKIVKEKEVLKVPFSKLFDQADKIGRFIDEDWECPSWRKKLLKTLNVQLNWDNVSRQFKVPETLKDIPIVTPSKIQYVDLVKEICKNDIYAIRFLAQARAASELYRQLDQGKPIDIQKSKDILESMATEWVVNPFVRTYFASLAPSALEKYRSGDFKACPVDVDVVGAVVYCIHGNDGVKNYMPKVRELSDKILKEKP
jgi:hypothetical protein